MEDPIELRKSFERSGRIAVQAQCDANRATGTPMQDREIEARKWLAELAHKDESEKESKRDAREEETLSIARRALNNSTRANIIAITAIIFAAAATISAAIIAVKLGN